jgi:hypothetical protein
MFRRLSVAVVTAAAFSLALTGCGGNSTSGSGSGSGSNSSSAGGSAGGDAVAWAEKVCKSVEPEVASLSKMPDVDTTDLQKTKDSMVAYLGKFSTALGHMSSAIKDAGDPPVSNAKADVDKVTGALESAKKTVDEAKANLDKASASDPTSFQEAFTKVGEDLSKLSNLDLPTKGLEENKELKDAFDKAPTCKKIDETAGGSNSSAPTS